MGKFAKQVAVQQTARKPVIKYFHKIDSLPCLFYSDGETKKARTFWISTFSLCKLPNKPYGTFDCWDTYYTLVNLSAHVNRLFIVPTDLMFSAAISAFLLSSLLLLIDLILTRHVVMAILFSVVVTLLVFFTTMAVLLVAGLSNAYERDIVYQETFSVTHFEAMTFTEGEQICGAGEDYLRCLNQHVTMYNTVCVGSLELEFRADARCGRLDKFIDESKKTYDTCGYGCTTEVSGNQKWGWPHLKPQPVVEEITVDEIIVTETCWFSLGNVQLGYCDSPYENDDADAYAQRSGVR